MRIPSNMTEAETIEAINQAVKSICLQYVHGCNDVDDMFQWGWLISLKFLEKTPLDGGYDEVRPLFPVLRTHLTRRYLNMIRKDVRRSDPPCKKCASGDYCTGSRQPCERYEKWQKTNNDKAALSKPAIFVEENEDPPTESETVIKCSIAELQGVIEGNLTPRQRKTLLMLQDDCKDSLSRRKDLEARLEELTDGKI